MKIKLLYLLLIIFIGFTEAQAQVNVKDTTLGVTCFSASYAFQIPGGDLKDRFGANSNIGFNAFRKTKSNWAFGLGFQYLFGNDIKENNILDSLKNSDDVIIGEDGLAADYTFYERGFNVSLLAGKIIPITNYNRNSGLLVMMGGGLLQHKIRIDVVNNTAPQLSSEMKKGYDRLTNGFALNQFIGYMHMSNNRRFNFYLGFDFTEGFTKSRRSYNYDTMMPDTKERFDLLYGFRFGWIIPLYKRGGVNMYYD